jgi:5,6-dimethylbenzimidazole synthase
MNNNSIQITPAERDGLYNTIYNRRDTRAEFLADPVSDEVLQRVLNAAHHAPSVGFMQPWGFIVVRDQGIRQQIKDAFEVAHSEAAEMFEGEKQAVYRTLKLEGIMEAPLGITITCDRKRTGKAVIGRTANQEMDLYSSVYAVQNLWLAARAENLGVGWVSIIHHKRLKEILGIPQFVVPIAYLCIGHVSHFHDRPELEKAGWLPRLPIEGLIHNDRW